MFYGMGNNRGHILVLFAHFVKVNLKAFHLLSLALYFFKRRILTGIESEVKPSHSYPLKAILYQS